MSKQIKNMLVDYLQQRYEGASSACVIDMTGMTVDKQQALRTKMREKNARVELIRNRLARKAFEQTPLQPLADVLTGPSALVTSDDSIIDVAKALVQFFKENKQPVLKQAMVDGDDEVLSVELLSQMMSRDELLAEIAALIGGPGRRLAGAIGGPAGRVAGCLQAIAERS